MESLKPSKKELPDWDTARSLLATGQRAAGFKLLLSCFEDLLQAATEEVDRREAEAALHESIMQARASALQAQRTGYEIQQTIADVETPAPELAAQAEPEVNLESLMDVAILNDPNPDVAAGTVSGTESQDNPNLDELSPDQEPVLAKPANTKTKPVLINCLPKNWSDEIGPVAILICSCMMRMDDMQSLVDHVDRVLETESVAEYLTDGHISKLKLQRALALEKLIVTKPRKETDLNAVEGMLQEMSVSGADRDLAQRGVKHVAFLKQQAAAGSPSALSPLRGLSRLRAMDAL